MTYKMIFRNTYHAKTDAPVFLLPGGLKGFPSARLYLGPGMKKLLHEHDACKAEETKQTKQGSREKNLVRPEQKLTRSDMIHR